MCFQVDREGWSYGSSHVNRHWTAFRLAGQRSDEGARLSPQSDLIIGVVGALVGGFLAAILLKLPTAVNGIEGTSIGWSFVGAVVLLAALQLYSRRNRVL